MKIIKKKIHNKDSRKIMMEGIDEMSDVVGSTMGGRGRNVILDKEYGAPLVVNDGVTIIREIFFEDNLKNVAAQLIKDAAVRTNDLAGDGTTGATILARSIVKQGWKAVEEGANPVVLRKEIDAASVEVLKQLKSNVDKVDNVSQAVQVAAVSVQDALLGEQIGSMMHGIGVNGAVTIKNSIKRGVYVEKDGGMRIEGQLVGGVVDNPDKWESRFEHARVLILKDELHDHELESKWIPLVRQFAEANPQGQMQKVIVPAFIVVAEKLPRRMIMMMNSNKDIVKWVWFRPTTAGKNMKEIYKDIQSMIGGKAAEEEEGIFLQKMTVDDLGTCESAICGRHDVTFTVSEERMQNNEYLDRVVVAKEQVENAEDEVEQEQIRDRLANLTGGVAVIKVAAATDQDTLELKLRIEDAINATRAAMEEGTVAGGGVALMNASKILKGVTKGEKVLKVACEAAIRQILYNAGYEDVTKILKGLDDGEGIDVLSGKIGDMKEMGIIDPLKVVRLLMENAVSVAGLLLTSEFAVTDEEDEADAVKRFFTPSKE